MDLSTFIVDAMQYIDHELDKVNPCSVKRFKVRSKINTLITSQAKELILLPQNKRQEIIWSIFRECLANELFK